MKRGDRVKVKGRPWLKGEVRYGSRGYWYVHLDGDPRWAEPYRAHELEASHE